MSRPAHRWTLVENMLTILDPCEQLTGNISKAAATAADFILAIQSLTCLLKQSVTTGHGVKTSKETLKSSAITFWSRRGGTPVLSGNNTGPEI